MKIERFHNFHPSPYNCNVNWKHIVAIDLAKTNNFNWYFKHLGNFKKDIFWSFLLLPKQRNIQGIFQPMKTHKKGNQITLILLKLDQWSQKEIILFYEVDLISKVSFKTVHFQQISNGKFKRTVHHFQTKHFYMNLSTIW